MEQPKATGDSLPFLIRRAQTGDPDAFSRIVCRYRDRIFRWALVRTGDEDDAEDAAQETLVRLHAGLRKFRGGSSFETWLYAITRNAAADIMRRRKSRLRMTLRLAELGDGREATTSPDPLETVFARRIEDVVREFLTQLPTRQREAVDLVDLQGLSPAEAASLTGANAATLRTHLFRGRRALRQRLLDAGAAEGAP